MSTSNYCPSFVIGLPTCPGRECCRNSGCALVATRRFGYRRNRLSHCPKFAFTAQVPTIPRNRPRDRRQRSRHIGGLLDQTAHRQPRHVRNILVSETMAEFQHRGAPFQKYGAPVRIEPDRDVHHDPQLTIAQGKHAPIMPQQRPASKGVSGRWRWR